MEPSASTECKRLAALGAVVLGLSVGVAACGGGSSGGGGGDGGGASKAAASDCPGTLVIGAHTTSTGGAAVYGQSFEPALKLWADDTNKAGGILGRRVQIKTADDGFDNARGGAVATELTARDNANFVLGPVAPGPAAVAAPVYDRAGILALAPTTAGPAYADDGSVRNATMYSTAPERETFMTVVGKYIQSQGYSKPALLVSQDTYGPPYQKDTEAAFKALGLKIVASEGFDPTATDLVSAVRKLRDAGADVVVPLTIATASFASFFTALDKIGWNPPIAGPYALGSAPWSKFKPHAAKAAFAEYAAVTRNGSTPASDLSAKVGTALKNVPVFDYGIEGYLAGEVLRAAITKAKSCKTDAVVKAMTSSSGKVMGQQVTFPSGSHLGGAEGSLKMVKPLSNDPTNGLLEVVGKG